MTATHRNALKLVAVLWVIWGLVHMLAGAIIIPADASAGFAAVADKVDPALLQADYHPAAGAILNQHGFNLFWIGATTTIAAFWVWRGSLLAAGLAALVGGLADIGYFLFLDLGGFVNFVPGTLMTLVSGSAVLLSAWVCFTGRA